MQRRKYAQRTLFPLHLMGVQKRASYDWLTMLESFGIVAANTVVVDQI